MTRTPRSRRGFALLAVLWVLIGVATLGILLAATGRDALGTAANRARRTRARWVAEGCIARANGSVASTLDGAAITDSVWDRLDRMVSASPLVAGCELALSPVGLTLDVNSANATQLHRLAVATGMRAAAADSLAEAILDWRDLDDEPRPFGAERGWYAESGRAPPRNGPIASPGELAAVRGIDSLAGADSLLGTEPGRILLTRAPIPVLATLPGFGPEVLTVIAQRRASGDAVTLPALAASVSEAAGRELMAAQPELVSLIATVPDAWVVTATVRDARGESLARLDLRVVRSGNRLAVLRRRWWP